LSIEALQDILDMETMHMKDSFSPSPMPKSSSEKASLRDYDGGRVWVSEPFLRGAGGGEGAGGVGGGGMGGGDEDEESEIEGTLPYHWFEIAEMLLNDAADDVGEADRIRQLLRDIREVRLSKMRKGLDALSGDGEGVRLDGVGAMELSESRGFVLGVVDGLRKVGGSKEQARREREDEEREERGGAMDEDEDEDML
jgi:GINS complex subunit 2